VIITIELSEVCEIKAATVIP